MNLKKEIQVLLVLWLVIFCCGVLWAAPAREAIGPEDLIYFIMTDRFNDGDPANNQNVRKYDMTAYHGGDFQGIIDKLDYIQKLGFTAIWISPVVANQVGGYHGYWAVDFYRTNEHFGSLEKLRELTQSAHSKGLKVIVDLVVNHTGSLHPWVGDANYRSWFHSRGNITNYNNQLEVEEGRLAGLPDLAQENPETRRYLIEMAKWWIRETGIDGYRLDTVKHVSQDFWWEFTAAIKAEYPDFYFLGEVFDGRVDYVARYQSTGISGLTDFPVYYAINSVFGGYEPANRLAGAIEQCAASYQNPFQMGTFIDNHDVPRFISQASNLQRERLKQALAFMMTYTGIPVLYYGTEIGLEGGADPDNRRDMDWTVQTPLTEYVRQLTLIRKTNRALTHGKLELMKIERNFLCFLRTEGENRIITAFNLTDQRKQFELTLPQDLPPAKGSLRELTGLGTVRTTRGKIRLKMEPRQVFILNWSY